MKKLLISTVFIFLICNLATAQSKFPELDKIKQIKLLESTREDVKKIFEDDNEDSDGDYYKTENFRISLDYSNGDCLDEDSNDEWNVPEGKVVEINVVIKDSKISKDLKINLSKLERIKKHENDDDGEEAEEDSDDYVYYDKENGISYGLDDGEVANIKFTPLEKKYPALCNNEDFRELNSPEEWFLAKIKHRYHREIREYSVSVAELALSKNEIAARCFKNKLSKGEVCAEDASIEVAAKGESSDPNDVLIYLYKVSSGKIIGDGANVIWDLSGVKPGTYTITAAADNGCGVCGTTKTEEVTVKECPDCKKKPK